MTTYEFSITENRAEALQERGLDALHAYLESRGLVVEGVALSLDPPLVRVTADADPAPFVAGIPWPTRRNHAQARQAMKAFMEASPPTQAQVVAALRGVIVELARD